MVDDYGNEVLLGYRLKELEDDVEPLKLIPGRVDGHQKTLDRHERLLERITWAIIFALFTVLIQGAILYVTVTQ